MFDRIGSTVMHVVAVLVVITSVCLALPELGVSDNVATNIVGILFVATCLMFVVYAVMALIANIRYIR